MFALLAMVYTVPPLEFLHRGLGEINVAITLKAGAIMAGYAAQGGGWTDSALWLLALQPGVSATTSILFAGCPDREVDAAAAKRTPSSGNAALCAWRWRRACAFRR